MSKITKTRVVLKNHTIKMFVGLNDEEYLAPQNVIVNAKLDVKINITKLHEDDINDVYNYVALKEGIENIAKAGHIGLIENFAEQIADYALSDKKVSKAIIYVQKPDIFGDDMDSVGVEITKEKETTC